MALKAKDISKLTKEEAVKRREELTKSLFELEPTSQKRKSIKKTIARLNTYIHKLGMEKVAVKKVEPKKEGGKQNPNVARKK